MKFCVKNELSPSVRAGGYGIAGWAVAGDIVIDMSLIREISIEAPVAGEDGTNEWTRLRNMPTQVSQDGVQDATQELGREPAPPPPAEPATSTKRRREESPVEIRHPDNGLDIHLRNYDAASNRVADFLRGPPLPSEDGEEPRQPPTNRQRVHSPEIQDVDIPHLSIPPVAERQISSESSTSSADRSSSLDAASDDRSTDASSPAEAPADSASVAPGMSATSASNAPDDFVPSQRTNTSARDPFGYMTGGPSVPAPAVYSGFRAFPSTTGPVNMFGRPMIMPPNIFSSDRMPGSLSFPQYGPPGTLGHIGNMTRARPVHPHAYVTIGAGMKQKEIDVYTASNPLKGVSSVSGAVEEGLVPYHVPT